MTVSRRDRAKSCERNAATRAVTLKRTVFSGGRSLLEQQRPGALPYSAPQVPGIGAAQAVMSHVGDTSTAELFVA